MTGVRFSPLFSMVRHERTKGPSVSKTHPHLSSTLNFPWGKKIYLVEGEERGQEAWPVTYALPTLFLFFWILAFEIKSWEVELSVLSFLQGHGEVALRTSDMGLRAGAACALTQRHFTATTS
jgi:hypothetical protein